MAHTTPTHTNRLIGETSPYLLQHAHNPVDWYPWGQEALERARREDRLILLSIGYSACHWCHVMERQSFEQEEIAALMNEHYVNIKVDREERPDLDDVYMAVTVAMNHGQGGWPMTVFLTPTLEPVFAGTYFPPADGHGRPAFPTLLTEIARAWREDRDQVRDRARQIAEQLRRQRRTEPGLAVGEDELRIALRQYAEDFDATHGGFGPAPKFPPATGLMLLLRLHRRFDDDHALTMVRTTLAGMAHGGIYDQIGGGFARYATDDRWLVPHFEKMLYDNALLSRAYLDAYQLTGDALYERIATETLDYILREMTSPDGGFYSSTDADSEGEEGAFFVWMPEEIVEVLGAADAAIFNAYYDLTPSGNWEGKSILHCPRPVEAVASALDMAPDAVRERLERLRVKVCDARDRRVRPALDDKIITAWNGLMIGAMAEGYRVLRHPRYAEAARRAADFVMSTLRDDVGRPLRTYRAGTAHLTAFLDDHAYLSEGLLDLYEATGETAYLREAERLATRMIDVFGDDESGAFFNTPEDHEALLWRYREGTDGATPSANAAAAWVMARLAHHLGREELRARAIDAVKAYGRMITRFPRAFAKSLIVVDWLLGEPIELAFVGARETPELEALCQEAARHFIPHRIQAVYDPAVDEDADVPLLRGKGTVDGKAALYVCRAFTCEAPVTEPAGVALALEEARPDAEPVALISTRRAGRATAAGTAGYAARFEHTGYRPVSDTGLITSLLGFGGYRTDDMSSEHREAFTRALAAGINLVDTSTNYADGASERLVGSVVRELTEAGEIERAEVIVVSKLGYIQGTAYRLAREREARDAPFPEVVKIEDGLWHCVHPEFLADQLQRSLDRLELETLDICLLHNPEYALAAAARRGEDPEEAQSTFYRRLTTAFRYLEDQVAAGRVSWYGVSSNTAAAPASDPEATSLTRMIAAAESAAGSNHHFRVLQLPLNLFEARAVLDPGDGRATVLDVARAKGVAVFANRPLNAFTGDGMVRLAEVRVDGEPIDLDSQFERVRELERTFAERLGPELQQGLGAADPSRIFDWAEQLRRVQPRVRGLEQWAGVERQVNYAVGHLAMELQRHLAGEMLARWAAWRDQYLPALDRLIKELRRRVAEQALADATAVKGVIDPLFPEEHRRESLARKALWTVASTPGVTAVLNGMRAPRYVHDAVGIMSWSPLEDPLAVYRSVQALGS